MLHIFDQLPDGLLERDATRLHEVLPGPSLIHLAGKKTDTLFISVLLHGNETTGWEATRELLIKYSKQPLPRSVCLFIGNVAAARHVQRHLPEQPDYNRIWKCDGDSPEHHMARQVIEKFKSYVRGTEDYDQVNAGQMMRKAKGLYSMDSEQTIMVSRKHTKIDGERIFMG